MQIKSSLYEVRRKRLPALPQSRADVHFETCSGENFLLAEDGEGDSKIVVFAADGNLKLLCDAETIYVDGTFSTCPHLFYQIFTFHAFRHGKQFPLVYCLLPNKRCETYIRSFEIVKQKAEHLELNLNPDVVLSDFELAISQAAQLVFPRSEFKGCLYHFCQALSLR